MVMCRFKGCVSEAQRGDTCAAHAVGTGRWCKDCEGTGTTKQWMTSAAGTHQVDGACPTCGGVGLRDSAPKAVPKRGISDEPIDERGLLVERAR